MSGSSRSELGKGPQFRFDVSYSVWWNLFLITTGSLIVTIGIKSLAVPYEFIPAGVFGLATLAYYMTDTLTPGWLNLILNIPLFLFAWFKVSRRFFLYSAYATIVTTVFYDTVTVHMPVHSELYAAIASGVITGFGAGLVLRSLGSNGGLDVIAVYLYQRFNLGIGRIYLLFNTLLFSFSLLRLPLDIVIVSLIMVFITSVVVEQTLSLFSQRKVVFIISKMADSISDDILYKLKQSATFLKGFGAFSRQEKNVLMTVVNNVQLKKLEEITFTHDENALFIVENTFSVIGASFSRRKIY
ncbi:YitT family protein [Pseudodesulfovibrio sp. zrk46]|uniref:YitT family protein n=1 Tax=Pseudodesulfovibrio sp. zrk46 TaxID=2725288 RepID=UPI0014498C3A|nr:YitT family protein [Pseudodesulfovibrio sp. zrk46]QJB56638.1 YitT family protein [Pseudodesulfovibrio sp. zrk46]